MYNVTYKRKELEQLFPAGDIAFRILDQKRKKRVQGESFSEKIVCCDINASMLKVGEERAQKMGFSEDVEWVEGDAQKLPFEDSRFDAYTIAFGIRNVVRIEEVKKLQFSNQDDT